MENRKYKSLRNIVLAGVMSAVGSGCFMSDPNIERGFFAMSIVNPTQRNRLAYRGVHVGRDMENYSKSKKKKSYEGEENITSEKEYKTYGQGNGEKPSLKDIKKRIAFYDKVIGTKDNTSLEVMAKNCVKFQSIFRRHNDDFGADYCLIRLEAIEKELREQKERSLDE